MNEKVDITDTVNSPEILAGCRLVERVDPTDAAYRLIEMRMPAMPIPGGVDRSELSGTAAMTAAVQLSLGSILWPLASYDQDLANDVIAAFKDMRLLPEDFAFTMTITEAPPS
mgnify:CR=1 FL=1